MPKYRADALANGLRFDEAQELLAVKTFTRAVEVARTRLGSPQSLPPLPSWSDMAGTVPGLAEGIRDAVEGANR